MAAGVSPRLWSIEEFDRARVKSQEEAKSYVTGNIFGKVQTNRASLNKHIEFFKKHKQGAEFLISPRPKRGSYQQYYYALLKFSGETKNRSYFTALKNFKSLSEEEYNQELELIKFYWEA